MSTVLLLFLFYNKLLLCLRLNFDDTIVLVLISTLEHKNKINECLVLNVSANMSLKCLYKLRTGLKT